MNIQQIQAKKLDLIGWIYNIQDTSILDKLKTIQENTNIEEYEASLKPMTKQELINRAIEANEAIKNNQVTSQEDLQKEIKTW